MMWHYIFDAGDFMSTKKKEFFYGIKAVVPLLVGVIPFSLIASISAINAGFSEQQTIGMATLIFAGASQLAAIDLVSQNAHSIVIVLTALIINLRFCMYSASLAPHFNGLPFSFRMLLAYLLTDHAYAVSIVVFNNEKHEFKHYFYLGAAITLWTVWQTCTIIGILLGTMVPASWSLGFAVPLTFLGLLSLAVTTRPTFVAAATAGVIALMVHGLPYNLGLFIAALGGIALGFLTDRLMNHAV